MPRDDDMDMDFPGMRRPAVPAPPAKPAAPAKPREPRPQRPPPAPPEPVNGHAVEGMFNPYAGPDGPERWVPMSHQVYESMMGALGDVSEQLMAMGYSSRQASQAELVRAILHFHTPRTPQEATDLLQRWGMVKASPPTPPKDR